MQLTLDNFQFSISVISGRLNPFNIPLEKFQNIGWQGLESPTENEARELAERYISVALQDLSSGLALLSIELSNMATVVQAQASEIESLRARVEILEG